MRTSTAYFAGVGTVMVAVAAGLGGGYLAANIVSPPTQAVSKLERSVGQRNASPEPTTVGRAPAEPVPYIAAKDVTTPAAAPAPQQTEAQPQPSSEPPAQIQAAAPAIQPAIEEKPADSAMTAPPAHTPAPKVVDSKPEQKPVAPRDAYARAGDAEVKRMASERRRAERRQQAAERRQQPSREQDLDVVEARIREVTEPRRMRVRDEAEARDIAGPARNEAPRIRLFDLDD